MHNQDLTCTLKNVAHLYPTDMIKKQLLDIKRITFNINIALNAVKQKNHTELEICDIGGGIGLFSVGCAAYGAKRVVLIDDFNDSVNHAVGSSILDIHRKFGVNVISRDVISKGISDITGTFDIITTFDSMEHWHHSPKKLFHEIKEKLNPGGVFIIGAPNCVNLRKRITLPLGIGKWSDMHEWYESEIFRGHVREPNISDLKYIAQDMGLTEVILYGRNWAGHSSKNNLMRFAAKILDYPMRFKPSLCSDLYMIGKKDYF